MKDQRVVSLKSHYRLHISFFTVHVSDLNISIGFSVTLCSTSKAQYIGQSTSSTPIRIYRAGRHCSGNASRRKPVQIAVKLPFNVTETLWSSLPLQKNAATITLDGRRLPLSKFLPT
jgi:hypothetical protein